MPQLPVELYRASQVRELDRVAIEEFSIPGYTLMQRAGEAAFHLLQRRWPNARQVTVLAGTGNNGGDGYEIARLVLVAGLGVRVLQLGDTHKITGDARTAREAYLEAGGGVQEWQDEVLPDADVIVDALLGTGLEREVKGVWGQAIDAINAHPAPRLSVDIPSGLHSDTGTPLGSTVRAQCTMTFIGMKQGLFTGCAADYCGDVYFDDLKVPTAVYERQSPAAHRIEPQHYSSLLRLRRRTSHKGDFGHVLVVGGDHGMSGAVRLAAEAAARTGAGLVSVATRATHAPTLNATCPVLMVHGVETVSELDRALARSTVVAMGPGLGKTNWARSLFNRVIDTRRPLVIDADALNLLADEPIARDSWVLTPHPGEAARLLGTTASDVQQDRFTAVEEMRSRYEGVVVLKGAGTLIRSGTRTAVCSLGNPGMASGGMGDLLTGIIAGLLAQGLSLSDAAELGVCVHASAADLASAQGERGLLATDLLPHLRVLLNS